MHYIRNIQIHKNILHLVMSILLLKYRHWHSLLSKLFLSIIIEFPWQWTAIIMRHIIFKIIHLIKLLTSLIIILITVIIFIFYLLRRKIIIFSLSYFWVHIIHISYILLRLVHPLLILLIIFLLLTWLFFYLTTWFLLM